MVVQIENARTNPSVGTLCRIADAYGVTVARLLESGADRRVHIRSADDAVTLWQGERGGIGRLLAGVNDDSPFRRGCGVGAAAPATATPFARPRTGTRRSSSTCSTAS